MAMALMLMSQGQEQALAGRGDSAPGRVFVCKTCNRVFPSFQALGGHRASHKKPRLDADGGGDLSLAKPKLHGCSICGVEFAIGQALGGHMRRHRAMIDNKKQPSTDDTAKSRLWLDLNRPPCDDDNGGGAEGDCGRNVDGLVFHQFLDNSPMTVDCVGY